MDLRRTVPWWLIAGLILAGCSARSPEAGDPTSVDYLAEQARQIARVIGDEAVAVQAGAIRVTVPTAEIFADGEANVPKDALEPLMQIASILAVNEATLVAVNAHTNVEGTPDRNLVLSQRRAQAVASVFADQGVEIKRMRIEGYGEQMPVADPETEVGKAKNPRLVLVITPGPQLVATAPDTSAAP